MKSVKKLLLLLIILIFGMSLVGYSQDTVTIYMDSNFIDTEIENASFIRKVIISNDHYYVTDSDIKGKMVNYGEYKSANPWIEDGLSIHYDLNGEKYSSGNYLDGNLSGKWDYYQDGKIETVNYDIDLTEFQADLQSTNEEKKEKKLKQKEESHIEAITDFFNKNFHFPARAKSKNENFDQLIVLVLDIDGKIKRPEIINFIDKDLSLEIFRILLEYRSKIEVISPIRLTFNVSFNDKGKEEVNDIFIIVEKPPRFTYLKHKSTLESVQQFISDSLRIPDKACNGNVMVNFVVEKDGSISNVSIILGIENCPGYIEEIERLFKTMPLWIPGTQKGKAVRVKQSAFVHFKK